MVQHWATDQVALSDVLGLRLICVFHSGLTDLQTNMSAKMNMQYHAYLI